jgi:Prokaryotic Cytochrome C oxidase subunit IV
MGVRPVITLVWLLLLVLTLGSWGLFELGTHKSGMTAAVVDAYVLLVALFKVRLVLLYFMEAATAPVVLRLALDLWLLLVGVPLVFQTIAAAPTF